MQDIELMFRAFLKPGLQTIDYNEFIDSLRGNMTGLRLQVVQQAFQSIDLHNLGQVHVDAILRSFNA